jgi:hypothetical protein
MCTLVRLASTGTAGKHPDKLVEEKSRALSVTELCRALRLLTNSPATRVTRLVHLVRRGSKKEKVSVASKTVIPRKDSLRTATSWTKSKREGIHNLYY